MSVAGNDFSISNKELCKEPLLSTETISKRYKVACHHAEDIAYNNLTDYDDADLCMDIWAGMYENSMTSLAHLEKKELSEETVKEAVRELAYARTYAKFINEMNGEGALKKGHEGLTDVFANVGRMKAAVQPLVMDTLPKVLSKALTETQKVALMKLDNMLNEVVGITETGKNPKAGL